MTNISNRKILHQKVAYISDQQFPIDKADSEQTMNTVAALASEGLDVDLIIPRKWRNFATSNKNLKNDLLNFYHVNDGFKVTGLLHLPLTPLRLEKYSHGILAPIYAAFARHDIIITRNPLTALVALSLGKKVLFDTYKIYSRFKAKIVKPLLKLINSPNVLGIITHSIPSKESLIKIGVAEEKISAIPNGFNPVHVNPRLTKPEARQVLGWPETEKIACYSGRLDRDKGITTILELAEKTPEITYILIGKTRNNSENWIDKMAAQNGLKNIKRLPWMKTKELSKYLFASDVLIIPPTAAPMMKYGKTVLPIKLFIYLGAGRPILAPALPDSQSVLNQFNAALVEPDNLVAAQKSIRKVFEEKEWARSLGEQAKLDSENYTWQCRAKKIVAFIKERLEVNKNGR